jgi:hypothetical protein
MEELFTQGKYYLGDPCFALSEYFHHEMWGENYQYKDGKFDLTLQNEYMIVHSTHYGDGTYVDTKNRKYKVESGTIALIPFTLISDVKKAQEYGQIFEFPEDGFFIYDGGQFVIRSSFYIIKINTLNEDMIDEDNEEYLIKDNEKVKYLFEDDNSDFGEMDNEDEEEEVIEQKSFFKNKII